jgi:hypothetical protein
VSIQGEGLSCGVEGGLRVTRRAGCLICRVWIVMIVACVRGAGWGVG